MKHEVRSPSQGAVHIFYVDDGAAVEAGDLIMATELMKMMVEIRSPVAGRVTFTAALGSQVAKGDLLAIVEDD